MYDHDGKKEVVLESTLTPRDMVVQELSDTVVNGVPATHDGRWGLATLEVFRAVLESAESGREVLLDHQMPVPR